jgi:hypothetical protein
LKDRSCFPAVFYLTSPLYLIVHAIHTTTAIVFVVPLMSEFTRHFQTPNRNPGSACGHICFPSHDTRSPLE